MINACEVLYMCMYYLKKNKNKNQKKKNQKKNKSSIDNDGNLLASAIEEHLTHLTSAVIKRFLHMDKTDIGNHEHFWAVILFGALYYNYIGL